MDGTGESGQQRTEPLPSDAASSGGESSFSTLSAEEFESWTLLDGSPKRSKLPQRMDSESVKNSEPEKASHSDDEIIEEEEEQHNEDDEEVDEEEDESESDGAESVHGSEPADSRNKPSGVERVKEKSEIAKREKNARDDSSAEGKKKKTTDSRKKLDPHDGFSSDGISVISESEGSSEALLTSRAQPSLYFRLNEFDACAPPTPPLSPETNKTQRQNQLKRKRSRNDGDQGLIPQGTLMPWSETHRSSLVVLGVIVTAVAAILVGNSRMYHNRITEYNFQHEQRISELELENNILKNEMNKLKHLYTRSELDEQVQQAEFQWNEAMDNKGDEVQSEPEPEPEPEPPIEEQSEEPIVRKVPPQEDNIKRRVVWSGDDGDPMLVADKDYVLPEFCYNKNAVQDALFSEYTAKYCDIKQRKIESKQRKADHAKKHKKYKEPRDYTRYIHPTEEEIAEHQRQATAAPPKAPSLSPFEFDFHKAYETIKEEGAVVVDSLAAFLDLDPEPELLTPGKESSSECKKDVYDGYSADDESSTTTDEGSASSDSFKSNKVETVVEMQWDKYPSWVKEKYEHRPEMYDRVKKVLERHSGEHSNRDDRRNPTKESERRNEKEHSSREEYRKNGDWNRNGGNNQKDHRKNYNNGRSQDQPTQYKNQKQWQDGNSWKQNDEKHKQFKHGNGQREQHSGENKNYQTRPSNDSPATGDGSYANQYRNEYKHHKVEFRESSGEHEGKHFKKSSKEGSGEREQKFKEWSDNDRKKGRDGKHWDNKRDQAYTEKNNKARKEQSRNGDQKDSKEQKNDRDSKDWNDTPKSDNNSEKHKHHESGEESSGEGSYLKHYDNEYKNQYKQREEFHKKYNERKPNYNRRRDDDDDDDDEDDHFKHHQNDKRHDHRNDDNYRKSQKDWHEKHHKGKENNWDKHRDEKRHDRVEHAFQEKGR